MKIISDKVLSEPPHSLSPSKVKALMSLLPEECRQHIKVIHLSNQMFSNITFDRPTLYEFFSGRLKILSRGFGELEIVKEILIELAQSGLLEEREDRCLHWAVYARHLKKRDYQHFEALTKPYLNAYKEHRATT